MGPASHRAWFSNNLLRDSSPHKPCEREERHVIPPAPPRPRLALEPLEERAVPAVLASYAVTQDWGTGFQAQVQLINNGPAAVPFNQLQFTLNSSITSIYDAKLRLARRQPLRRDQRRLGRLDPGRGAP